MKETYMREALKEAEKARKLNEVPIGCVIVKDNKIIGRGYNRRMKDKNTLSHAELNAIKKASKKLKDWRLDDCELPDGEKTMSRLKDKEGNSVTVINVNATLPKSAIRKAIPANRFTTPTSS